MSNSKTAEYCHCSPYIGDKSSWVPRLTLSDRPDAATDLSPAHIFLILNCQSVAIIIWMLDITGFVRKAAELKFIILY